MLQEQIDGWLGPHGWLCVGATTMSELDIAEGQLIALFLLDGAAGADDCAAQVQAIRALNGPASGTPILLAGVDGTVPSGVSALLPVPLVRDSALATLEHWVGPLADHGFRDLANPYYRLMRLGGRTTADGLLSSFADQLRDALAWLDAPDPASPLPHQIAGLAGMVGFQSLSEHWRAIDIGDSADPEATRALTEAVIANIEDRISTS